MITVLPTPRQIRTWSLLFILAGLLVSSLYTAGVFDKAREKVENIKIPTQTTTTPTPRGATR